MISYTTLGIDDVESAKRFYSAFLPALGYELKEHSDGLSCVLKADSEQSEIR